MVKRIKEKVKNTLLYDLFKNRKQNAILERWEKSHNKLGSPLPHILKQFTIKDYAYKFDCSIIFKLLFSNKQFSSFSTKQLACSIVDLFLPEVAFLAEVNAEREDVEAETTGAEEEEEEEEDEEEDEDEEEGAGITVPFLGIVFVSLAGILLII